MAKKTQKFEDMLEELKIITNSLENEDVSLDESLKLFENGIKLYRNCVKKIDDAQAKVEILVDDELKIFEEVVD